VASLQYLATNNNNADELHDARQVFKRDNRIHPPLSGCRFLLESNQGVTHLLCLRYDSRGANLCGDRLLAMRFEQPMKLRFIPLLVLYVTAFLLWAPVRCTAEESAKVPIGSTIKTLLFKDIRHLPRSLDELGKKKAYVLAFTNTSCPLVRKYWPRLKQLHATYKVQGVQFVSINVGVSDSIRDVASQSLKYGILFPNVKDTTGDCVRLLGVHRTPEVVVLDANHRLVYRGRIDDQYRLGGTLPKPRQHYLRQAIDDLLSGKPIVTAETPVDGCEITLPDVTAPKSAQSLTFTDHVQPLIKKHCVRCHRPGTAAPFSLVTFEDVKGQLKMIAEVVDEQRMPPWYASSKHGKFQNDRSLTIKERSTIVDWIRAGAKPGNLASIEKNETQKEEPAEWRIGKPDLVITTLTSEHVPAEGFIPYKYSVLPYVFPFDTWVEAIEIKPSNRRVVHHANLAYGAPGKKPGVSTFLTGYVPGGQAMELAHFNNAVACKIPAFSMLGLQIHYTTTGKPEKCKISVGLRFARKPVQKQLHFRLLDPHRFRIEPRNPAYAVSESAMLNNDVSILGLFCHMHVRGKDMTFFAHHPNGKKQTLLEIPNYNFDWQHAYEIKPGDVKLPKGTRLEAVAHYDNSEFNPYNPDPDKTVRYGPQTFHEMMNGYVFFTIDSEQLNLKINPKTGWVLSK
jgi:thiol-disulfide isomerase/thioredoxin